jgi:hypothetical protein
MELRTMAFSSITLVGELGLIGTGAYASWRGEAHWDSFDGGVTGVVVSASGAPGNGTSSITLSPVGPTARSFMTSPIPVEITNKGDFIRAVAREWETR